MKTFKKFKRTIKESISEDAKSHFMKQFHAGFKEELEHSETEHNDPVKVAKIVLDHLTEDKSYYSKLEKAGLTDK